MPPPGRGLGVGKLLAETVIKGATRLRYSAIVLDTLESMVSARALYQSLGVVETEAYYEKDCFVDKLFTPTLGIWLLRHRYSSQNAEQ